MKIKATILVLSLFCTTLLISGGYGYWQKSLTIRGDISVVSPDEVIIPPIEQPILMDTSIEPANNLVEGSSSLTDNQRGEQLPLPVTGATATSERNNIEPEQGQVEEQGDEEGENALVEKEEPTKQTETTEQVEQIKQTDQTEQSEQTDRSHQSDQTKQSKQPENTEQTEQAKPSEIINEERAPSNEDNESSQNVDSTQTESKETTSMPHANVGDEE